MNAPSRQRLSLMCCSAQSTPLSIEVAPLQLPTIGSALFQVCPHDACEHGFSCAALILRYICAFLLPSSSGTPYHAANLGGGRDGMFDIQQALERGRELHQAGRLNEAEGLYRQILAVDPNHADGLHLLGVMAHQRGHHELAVDLIGKAINSNKGIADFHCNFCAGLRALGRADEGEAHYPPAIRPHPNPVETYNNFG